MKATRSSFAASALLLAFAATAFSTAREADRPESPTKSASNRHRFPKTSVTPLRILLS